MGVKERAIGQAFNLGSGRENRVVDMANRVNEITGSKAGIEFVPRRDWDVKTRLCSSIDRARDVLGFRPTIDLENGLTSVHSWFKDNWVEESIGARSSRTNGGGSIRIAFISIEYPPR